MTVSAATATYRVRVATRGATVVSGNVDYTLAQADLADIPPISGPSVGLLSGAGTSHPFSLECITDDPLTVASGRMTAIGRLAEVQRDTGAGYVTIATGRISRVSEVDGRGKVTIEVSDERWVERRTEIFRTTDTVQLHPPGLASAWMDKPAAGTRSYTVVEVSGDAVRIQPDDEDAFDSILHIPAPLREALVSDMISGQTISASASVGNFTALRFEYDSADRTVICFRQGFNALKDTDVPAGILGNLAPAGSGLLTDAWVYISGHGLSVTDQITGRFYFPSGVAVSDNLPLHIGGSAGIHPFELLEDIYNGDFGGQAVRFDATAMQAVQDMPFKPVWARITEPAERAAWLQENLYAAYGVLPLVGTDLSIRPTSLRLPIDLDPGTLPVLTASDAGVPSWENSSSELVTALQFNAKTVRDLSPDGVRPDDWPPDGAETVDIRVPDFEHDNVSTLGRVLHKVTTALILSKTRIWFGTPFDVAEELSLELFDVFGDGAQFGEIPTAENAGHEVGDRVLIDHDTLKGFNPGTGDRTGERMALLMGFRELTPSSVVWSYLDLGPNSAPLSAPTLAIAQDGTDPNIVNVTVSGLAAGTFATVEVTVASSSPSTYDLIRSGLGNGSHAFRVAAGSGTAYCRGYTTAPNRIRSAYATDSVALSTRAVLTSVDLYKTSDSAVASWVVPSGTGGMRLNVSIHERGATPSFGSNIDFDTSADSTYTISNVPGRFAVTVRFTPYPGYSGGVTGTAGDPVDMTVLAPRVTGGIALSQDEPTVTIVDAVSRSVGGATSGGEGDQEFERDVLFVPNAACKSVEVEYSFIRPIKTSAQPPASTTFDVDYDAAITVAAGRVQTHTLEDGVGSTLTFAIQDNAGTAIKDSTFLLTLTPYSETGGAGGTGVAGTPATINVRTLGDSDDVGVRIKTPAGQEFAGHKLDSSDDIGFRIRTSDGELEPYLVGGGWTTVRITSDFVSSAAANTAITGLNFTPAVSADYEVEVRLLLRTATATVGARPGFTWPTGLTDLAAMMQAPNSATAMATRIWGATSGANAASTGLPDTTNSHFAHGRAIVRTGASSTGDVQVTIATETAATNVTVRAGSFLRYRRIA